ncbi:MAG: hypothetical protein GKR89_06220 [Candidatus Latescibacteria bacterium]|nr:hypothetical protein [Candidatus Latescibacterota bacterium]
MNPTVVPQNFRVIAHRGASAYAPENTAPAFQLARKMSITEVELDTQLSTDGVVVVCHDTTLQRYGHGDTDVEDLSSGELLSLDMGSWFSPFSFSGTPMMTLAQLLDDYGDDFIFHIELKGKAADLAAAVYSEVAPRDLLPKSIFTSFAIEQLARMREVSSGCRLGWLVQSFDQAILEQASELDLFQLCPRADLVSTELVEKGRQAVPEVRAWGMSGKPQEVRAKIQKVVESGTDGMTIDWPDWVTRKQ